MQFKFSNILNEGIRVGEIERAISIIYNYLSKYNISKFPIIDDVSINGELYKNTIFVKYDNDKLDKIATIFWKQLSSGSYEPVKVSIWNSFIDYLASSSKPVITFSCINVSLVKICGAVKDLLSNKILLNKENVYSYLKNMNLWSSEIISEGYKDEPIEARKIISKINTLQSKRRLAVYNKENTDKLDNEIKRYKEELSKIRLAVNNNTKVTIIKDKEILNLQEEIDNTTPDEKFDDMKTYISMILKGIRSSLIICGSPGIGKTYRVTKEIEDFKYKFDQNYTIIKGKCTPLYLYKTLMKFRSKDQIVVIDDADEILTDLTSINIIKAATDSSSKRYISYSSSRLPELSEDDMVWCSEIAEEKKGKYYLPSQFEYQGSIIMITNMYATSLDTALKNRALICNLDFSINDILNIIEKLAPKLNADILTIESKKKAIEYLKYLYENGKQVEISIRSFQIIAGLYNECPPLSEKAIHRMINEQMKFQYSEKRKNRF